MILEEPTLLFFRHRPQGWATSDYVASSLQSLETTFFLIAARRYPHALEVCASAIESTLQAANIGAKEKDGFQELVRKAKKSSQAIIEFGDDKLRDFRETRNRIVHRGFSPSDNSESTSLYLEVGLPFLALCYREFHQFDLLDGLWMECAEHFGIAQRVLALAKRPNLDMSYCLHSVAHLIGWCSKQNFSGGWEVNALEDAEGQRLQYEGARVTREHLENSGDAAWIFDCPVCHAVDCVVAKLDAGVMDQMEVYPVQMECTKCGFAVTESQPFLSQVLLEAQLADSKATILKKFGVD
ncbi:YheV family putative zinc ribbon protein [Caenimonas soli]|uniref:hypothetical protein n=1 Tax=Caenimonas soli TaxID=2735555 RepID=UPI001555D62F|nr:hypothetical protein [Caenimonas soli]NPC59350.1 hypothetical protein [Caenimonas soli]